MTKTRRVVIVILDSLGAGELPDASLFGDEGSNTLGNTARAVGGLKLPNLEAMGLGKIIPIEGLRDDITPRAFYGKMTEVSGAKDTTTGHWEITGIVTAKPFPTYPNGFPGEIIEKFTKAIGRPVLGNKPASGTEIIKELGEEHIRTGNPIVYTSADSVFQIAACETVIPVEELYEMCNTARRILTGRHNVGRVIARPFVVSGRQYIRTERRRDFSVTPPEPTLLDIARESGLDVIGVGKIGDIFAHRGLTQEIHTGNNREGIDQTIRCIKKDSRGIIFTNLIDFDMKYGHRNDPEGYAGCLEEFDKRLTEMLDALKDDDILSITADHGCDPTTPSTDHSREYVPLLVYGKVLGRARSLGIRQGFSDLGATIAEALELPLLRHGKSFYKNLFN
ncbi:MAG: phosphopentomutase [Planctomycetes bacterium RIFCSPHIGHO2_02_FULL_50_42]|nr:MAG: phosphopentomutase [Planctomycetes bacterium RIFCSPHIGHO2_02_FULL_50_42]OHB92829.1 MAG: phosphopentomutase [Planctomycetes bacterium RIFCSPHIGHO2_12_FULL_51_37]OHB95288.1 MAG: phosphopentomutase [Planctomycetes bacterium RIFCSPLOWO2_02_FULL_50_16]